MRPHRLYALLLLLLLAWAAAPAREEAPEVHSPLALAFDPHTKLLYVADYTARHIAAFDTATEQVLRRIPLPDRPSGLALSEDGRTLYVTAGDAAGKVYILDAGQGTIRDTFRAGHTPIAPVLSRDGNTLYVCNRFNDTVTANNLKSKAVAAKIDVGHEPVAAQLSADGKLLFVANQLPSGPSNSGNVGSAVSLIDTTTLQRTGEIRLPDGASGVRGLGLSPDGKYLYVTHILSRYQLPASQIERGWIQTNALAVIDTGKRKLATSFLLDDINLGAANPWGVASTADGKSLIVAHAGTHEVSVIDRHALHRKLDEAARGEKVSDVSASGAEVVNDMAFLTGIRKRIPLKGNGPRGVAVAGSVVYAAEYFTGTVGIVDLAVPGTPESRSVKLGSDVPLTAERRGEMLFHDAQFCLEKWLSCSSCHPNEGRPDGLNWDLMLDGVGNPKNTKSLLLSHQTPPTTITGTRPNAEASVRAGFRFIEFAQRPEEDAVAVDAYLKSLRPVPSPYLEDGKLSAAAERGRIVFDKSGCRTCHSGPHYTDLHKYSVGTGRGRETGIAFDTPTLIEIWRTAPYLHDGRAPTLKHLFTSQDSGPAHCLTPRVSRSHIDDLIAFVRSI